MSGVIESLERESLRRRPSFDAGDRVKVHFQVVEGTRRRTQVFEGIVIKRQGAGLRETFTVRKQSFGVGVERTFPLHSPKIEQIEVAARGDVRRAKLYYLRGRVGRRARVRERRDGGPREAVVTDEMLDAGGAQQEAAVESSGADPVEEAGGAQGDATAPESDQASDGALTGEPGAEPDEGPAGIASAEQAQEAKDADDAPTASSDLADDAPTAPDGANDAPTAPDGADDAPADASAEVADSDSR